MPIRHAVAITACLTLMLVACGSGDNTTHSKPPASTSPSDEPPSVADEPTEISTPQEPFALDEEWAWEATGDEPATGTTAALTYKQPITSIATAEEEVGQKGYVWSALELKVCVNTGTLLVSSFDWSLAYPDGARIEPSSSTYDDFPRPEFPTEVNVRAGDCVRGKVVFPVPGDQRPEKAVYAPGGVDQPVQCTVPEK